MRVVSNAGTDRAIDALADLAARDGSLDVASDSLSLFAYDALAARLGHPKMRLLLGPPNDRQIAALLGGDTDRPQRNHLQSRSSAAQMSAALASSIDLRRSRRPLGGAQILTRAAGGTVTGALLNAELSTAGLGLTADAIQRVILAFDDDSAEKLAVSFLAGWDDGTPEDHSVGPLARALTALTARSPARTLYHLVLHHLLGGAGDHYDEERVAERGSGFRDSMVWKKLYKFQRDGVVGCIEKLEQRGGCILADSVGLGKTFEALAVIKYYELRNERVLVICPKRLAANWTQYNQNNGNVLDADRLRYDVLFHTDLSRDRGMSGTIDLERVNWGNYDLVVIDESHNFRNKKTPKKGGETRYDRLLKRVVLSGVKTKVLMLSATPVNNRLADLRNQIAFATQNKDDALATSGIASIDHTVQSAQAEFNQWLKLPEKDRTAGTLIDKLGFDYFRVLDLLTIARSRKHIEKYYGTSETGKFPTRLPPHNERAPVDRRGSFRSIEAIQQDIGELRLAALTPMKYVLDAKRAAYEAKYDQEVGTGKSKFRQSDREDSLKNLMRVNLLKRLESSVESFALTVKGQLDHIERLLEKLDAPELETDEPSPDLLDLDDPDVEALTTGTKIKILIRDLDQKRLRQDIDADRECLQALLEQAGAIDPERDAKLEKLRALIAGKVHAPINPGNRKMIVFTAFADTAEYLYRHLAGWAKRELGLETGLVTGTAVNSTLEKLPPRMLDVLCAFAPKAKERGAGAAALGDLDLLIATDCISEGQNLQDCDTLVNYDIHWNPVRIIQRFGRIDRIGSTNARVQLVNFWPDIELDAYINLETRVRGRLHLLNVSATGEENVIADQDVMNDLEYRRKQLHKLQSAVPDMEELSEGLSIADATLSDYRLDLSGFERANPGLLASLPLGVSSVTQAIPGVLGPGVVFCLRSEAGAEPQESGYPLAPHYLVHVSSEGAVTWPYTQVKLCLEALKRGVSSRVEVETTAWDAHDAATEAGANMADVRASLVTAVAAIRGRDAERAAASLFSPGGTHTSRGSSANVDDFEVLGFLVVV